MTAPRAENEAASATNLGETRLIWASLLMSVALFAKFPRLDLAVAAHFYTPGLGFVHAHDALVRALYLWTRPVGQAIVVLLALFVLLSPWLARRWHAAGRLDRARRCAGPWRRLALVAVLSGALGPGLLIEGGLKNLVGRPRPVQVVELGGSDVYRGPFQPGPQPASHRSFVSSHAAAGFWLMSLGLTCGPRGRRNWLLVGLVVGSVVGMGRMMQGGHFLSDIVFAFYAVWVSCQAVAWWDRRRGSGRAATADGARLG